MSDTTTKNVLNGVEGDSLLVTPAGRELVPLNPEWRQEASRLRAGLQSLEERLHGAEVLQATLEEDLYRARRRSQDAQDEADLLRGSVLLRLEHRVDALESKLSDSERARVDAETALANTLASSAWRLTWPLRKLADTLRRRPHGSPAGEAVVKDLPE